MPKSQIKKKKILCQNSFKQSFMFCTWDGFLCERIVNITIFRNRRKFEIRYESFHWNKPHTLTIHSNICMICRNKAKQSKWPFLNDLEIRFLKIIYLVPVDVKLRCKVWQFPCHIKWFDHTWQISKFLLVILVIVKEVLKLLF